MGLAEDIVQAAQEHFAGACSQSLSQLPRNRKLEALLEKASEEAIASALRERCKDPNGDVVELLSALFISSPGDTPAGGSLRGLASSTVLRQMTSGTFRSQELDDTVHSLQGELSFISRDVAVQMVQTMLESLEGKALKGRGATAASYCWELFPHAYNRIVGTGSLDIEGESISVKEYKKSVIDALCGRRWPTYVVTRLVTALREIDMTQDELKRLIVKVSKQFSRMPCPELPPVVNQLLLLSMKGHKDLILRSICSAFDSMDVAAQEASMKANGDGDAALEELRQAEGTVLLHVNFAVKQDQLLGKAFLKSVCSDKHQVSPFTATMLLSIARILHFNQKVLDYFKAVSMNAFRDDVRCKESPWYHKATRTKKLSSSAFSDALLCAVTNSLYGWEHVLQSLVQLGFVLLDVANPKKPVSSEWYLTSRLGMSILCESFRLHSSIRGEIVEQIISRIVTRSSSTMSCIELLSSIVDSNTQSVVQFLPKIKETFDYVSFLELDVAEGLLVSVRELFRFSKSFQDHVILVLRKAVFSRELTARKIGIRGFFILLNSFQPSSSASSTSSGADKDQMELLGFLRRASTQQPEIRRLFYAGMTELFKNSIPLRGMILDILLVQFHRFYDGQALPPIRLSSCVEKGTEVKLVEPLPHLLSAIQQCIVNAPGMPMDTPSLLQLKEALNSLINRLPLTELEEFELDKSSDFSSSTSDGKYNIMAATLLLETYQVLTEYLAVQNAIPSQSSVDSIQKLFFCQQDIYKAVKAAQTGQKKTKALSPAPMLSDRGVQQLLSLFDVALETDSAELPETTEKFRSQKEFHESILSVVLEKVKNAAAEAEKAQSKASALLAPSTSSTIAMIEQVLPSLLYEFAHKWEDSSSSRRNVPYLALEIVEHCLCFVAKTQSTAAVQRIVSKLSTTGAAAETPSAVIHLQQKEFEMIATALLSSSLYKEVEAVLDVLKALCPHMPSSELSSHIEWVYETILNRQEEPVTSSNVLKKAVQLFLGMSYQQLSSNLAQITSLSKDVNIALGEHDPNDEAMGGDNPEQYRCLEDKSKLLAILPVMFHWIEKHMEEIDWAATICAAESTGAEKIARQIVQRTSLLVDVFVWLVPSDLKGPPVESLLKLVLRLYRIVSSVTKNVMEVYPSEVPQCFQQLIDKCGKSLTPQVYTTMFLHQEEASGKIKRETTLKPNLVFEAEKFESLLIKYGKKTKKNLLKQFKRSEVRDFRISNDKIREAAMQKAKKRSKGDGGSSTSSQAGSQDDKPPPKKKRKK